MTIGEATISEAAVHLGSEVRQVIKAELTGLADLRAAGVGVVGTMGTCGIGAFLINEWNWSENLGVLVFLIAFGVGFIGFKDYRERLLKEIEQHDDRMLEFLYERLERRKMTLIICLAIVLGALAISAAIVVPGLLS